VIGAKGSAVPLRRKKRFAISVRWEREQEERRYTGNALDKMCCLFSRQVGGMHILCEKGDGSPIIIAGPCWSFCVFVTSPLILIPSGFVSYFVVLNPDLAMPGWLSLLYFPIVAATLISLFCVSCRDPGLVERVTDEEAGNGGWFWNEQVGSFRPAGAMYCRECKALIQDYDHLCPWIGTGVGQGNALAFKLFIIFVNILCYVSIGLATYATYKRLETVSVLDEYV